MMKLFFSLVKVEASSICLSKVCLQVYYIKKVCFVSKVVLSSQSNWVNDFKLFNATRRFASYGACLALITEKSDYDVIEDVLLQNHADKSETIASLSKWKKKHLFNGLMYYLAFY